LLSLATVTAVPERRGQPRRFEKAQHVIVVAKNGIKALPQELPRLSLLFLVIVIQMVSPDLTAGEHLVLAWIDYVGINSRCLHHRGSRSAQIVRSPFAVTPAIEHE
jgi:hypothetical protein